MLIVFIQTSKLPLCLFSHAHEYAYAHAHTHLLYLDNEVISSLPPTAPKVFTLAYAVIKPFLHEVTLKKIRIFGYSGWKEALLKDIEADQLPQHWGGSRVDPDGDPKCPSVVSLCIRSGITFVERIYVALKSS